MPGARAFAAIAALALAAMAAGPAAAQGPVDRVPTVTRLVKLFLEQERALADAIRGGRAAAVDAALADDFELRTAARPGVPTPRAEWLRQVVAAPGPAVAFEQMAVHDYGAVAVVSFLQVPLDAPPGGAGRGLATVDVWKRAGDEWRLAVRYAGPSGPPDFVVPGATTEPPIAKRY